jgi:hypothetical protein
MLRDLDSEFIGSLPDSFPGTVALLVGDAFDLIEPSDRISHVGCVVNGFLACLLKRKLCVILVFVCRHWQSLRLFGEMTLILPVSALLGTVADRTRRHAQVPKRAPATASADLGRALFGEDLTVPLSSNENACKREGAFHPLTA